MKLEINTTEKLITILDGTSILELINFLKEKELEEYKIKSVSKFDIIDRIVERRPEYVPIPQSPTLPWYQPIWVYDPNSQPFYITTTPTT